MFVQATAHCMLLFVPFFHFDFPRVRAPDTVQRICQRFSNCYYTYLAHAFGSPFLSARTLVKNACSLFYLLFMFAVEYLGRIFRRIKGNDPRQWRLKALPFTCLSSSSKCSFHLCRRHVLFRFVLFCFHFLNCLFPHALLSPNQGIISGSEIVVV